MDGSFEQAVAFVGSSTAASSNETKLKVRARPTTLRSRSLTPPFLLYKQLYALFKIAIVSSRPTTSRPGLLDWTGRAKWDAWDKLGREERFQGEAGKQRAQEEYVEEARRLGFNAGERAGEGETQNVPKKEKQEQMVSVSTMGTDFVDEAYVHLFFAAVTRSLLILASPQTTLTTTRARDFRRRQCARGVPAGQSGARQRERAR